MDKHHFYNWEQEDLNKYIIMNAIIDYTLTHLDLIFISVLAGAYTSYVFMIGILKQDKSWKRFQDKTK